MECHCQPDADGVLVCLCGASHDETLHDVIFGEKSEPDETADIATGNEDGVSEMESNDKRGEK